MCLAVITSVTGQPTTVSAFLQSSYGYEASWAWWAVLIMVMCAAASIDVSQPALICASPYPYTAPDPPCPLPAGRIHPGVQSCVHPGGAPFELPIAIKHPSHQTQYLRLQHCFVLSSQILHPSYDS